MLIVKSIKKTFFAAQKSVQNILLSRLNKKVMNRFNRLFWKVFLSLWLSSFSVMIVTVIVIGEVADKDYLKAKLEFQVRLEVERFLQNYEQDPGFQQRIEKRMERKSIEYHNRKSSDRNASPRFYHRDKLPPLTIFDDKGQRIFGKAERRRGDELKLKVKSESGREYQVLLYMEPIKNRVARWQGFIFSVQAFLILMSSTLASIIVSAIVVRPMNQLRQHVKQLHEGELSVRTEEKLYKRGDEIGDFAREFNQMAEYVENTLKGQQHLFQNVSHELRAPLARLLAASGIIEQQVGLGHPAVARVQLECERLNVLIDELLSLAKLHQLEHATSNINVKPIIDKLLADAQFSEVERTISLQYEGEATDAIGSSVLLERALSNVLGNALKHTEKEVSIEINVSSFRDRLEIDVRDNGPGVPEFHLQKLCEPFMRLDTNVDGHGLGLGIAKQAMESQQGALFVSNRVPHGLSVLLTLRRAS